MIAEFLSQMKKSPPCSASLEVAERERPGQSERVVEVLLVRLERGHEHEQQRAERQCGREHEHDVMRQVREALATVADSPAPRRAHSASPAREARRRTQKSSAMNTHITPSSIVATAAACPGSDCTSPVL